MPRHNKIIPHQPFRPSSSCENKRRFKSEKEALLVAEDQMLAQPSLELSVYKCDFCGNWHLTSQSKK